VPNPFPLIFIGLSDWDDLKAGREGYSAVIVRIIILIDSRDGKIKIIWV